MDSNLIATILTGLFTLAGVILTVCLSNSKTQYRIEQLEKQVEKQNSLVERTALLERDLKTAFRYIDEMRQQHNR